MPRLTQRLFAILCVGLAVLIAFGALVQSAFAQTTQTAQPGLGTLSALSGFGIELAIVVIGPIVAGLLAAVLTRAYVWLGLKQTAENRETIEQVLARSVDFARARYGAGNSGLISTHMRQSALRAAAEYAVQAGPKALGREGIADAGSKRLEDMLSGRLFDFIEGAGSVASGTLTQHSAR